MSLDAFKGWLPRALFCLALHPLCIVQFVWLPCDPNTAVTHTQELCVNVLSHTQELCGQLTVMWVGLKLNFSQLEGKPLYESEAKDRMGYRDTRATGAGRLH